MWRILSSLASEWVPVVADQQNETQHNMVAPKITAPEAIVILGAGHAGVATAVGLRSKGWEGRIHLVEAESHLPYERPPLSKELLKPGGPHEPTPIRRQAFFDAKAIELVRGDAVAIDRTARTVSLADGSIQPYARLVIATGSEPRPLTVPGAGLPGVQLLKTLDDARQLGDALAAGRRVVVVGAGYIGLEVAAAASARGCVVTVLEFQDRIMARVTSAPVSRYFEELHRSHGVRFTFGAAVTAIEGDHWVERVVTSDGQCHPADIVVAGIGVVPRQRLAEAAGIDVADGILVDAAGRTSDPLVYAAGDVTRSPSFFDGASQRLECLQNAAAQAEAVAADITGHEPPAPQVPWFWTVQHGVRLQTAGVRGAGDDVVLRGDPASGRFSAIYLRDGRLAAVDTIGGITDFRPAKNLISQGASLDPVLAADPSVGLADSTVPAANTKMPAVEPAPHF